MSFLDAPSRAPSLDVRVRALTCRLGATTAVDDVIPLTKHSEVGMREGRQYATQQEFVDAYRVRPPGGTASKKSCSAPIPLGRTRARRSSFTRTAA